MSEPDAAPTTTPEADAPTATADATTGEDAPSDGGSDTLAEPAPAPPLPAGAHDITDPAQLQALLEWADRRARAEELNRVASGCYTWGELTTARDTYKKLAEQVSAPSWPSVDTDAMPPSAALAAFPPSGSGRAPTPAPEVPRSHGREAAHAHPRALPAGSTVITAAAVTTSYAPDPHVPMDETQVMPAVV